MNTVELFPSCEGILRFNMDKISLLCLESCCNVFEIEGAKGGYNEDSTLFVYLDELVIWVIITIRLLCLCFDKNRFIGSMKEHPENSHFSLFGPRVWTPFRSKIFFCHENWNEQKLSKSAICPVLQHGGFDPRIQSCHGQKSRKPIFSCFPCICDWHPFTSRKRLHLVRHSLLKSLLIVK